MAGPVADHVVMFGDTRRAWRRDAALLAPVAIVLRLPALLAGRHLTFDDGQYGAAVLGLRDGAAPFRDLFSSQGPLHYPLLWVADLVGFRTLDGPRILTVAAGAVATVATYAIARRLASRPGALIAAALLATSGSILYVTAPLSGDGPALASALVAILLGLRYRDRPCAGRAIAVGIAIGAALSIKLLVLPAAIPVGLLLLGWRPSRRKGLVQAVTAAGAVFLVSAAPWGISRVWDQSVAYHQNAERLRSYGANARVLLQTLVERDPFVVAALAASLVALLIARRAGSPPPRPMAPGRDGPSALLLLLPWLGAQALFLIIEPAMWRPHVSQVVVPMALLIALRPAPWRVVAVLGLALIPWWVSNTQDILWPSSYSRAEQAVVDRLRALPSGAWVISDDPGFAWRADRRVPGNFVDVSEKRERDGQITAAVVGRAASSRQVCAVVIWSSARFGSLKRLPDQLKAEGFQVAERYGGPRRVYERSVCSPSGRRRSAR